MLENIPHISGDETDSELYLDAVDNGPSKESIILEDDKYDLHEFQSSVCIWDHNLKPFQFGVYSQFLEARVVLKNNCPKGGRTCRYPERRNLHVKKIEGTVLTCQIANRAEKKRCPICCQATDHCICEKASIHSKPSSSSYQKQICTVCTTQAKRPKLHDYTKSKMKCGSSEIISILRDMSKVPTLQKHPNKFTSQAVIKSGTNYCRIPVKCGCKSFDKNHASITSYASNLSYISSEELQLVHGVRGTEPTETLKQKQCIPCDESLACCTCGNLKIPVSPSKCKFCGKRISSCLCSKWKNNYKRDDSMSLVAIASSRNNSRCTCGKAVNRKDYELTGIIEEVRPRSRSISTPFLVKRPGTPISSKRIDTSLRGTKKPIREEDHYRAKNEDKAEKRLHKLSDNKKLENRKKEPPPCVILTKRPQPSDHMENKSDEIKNPEEMILQTLENTGIDKIPQQSEKPHDIRIPGNRKESANRSKEKKQSEILKSDELKNDEATKIAQLNKKPGDDETYQQSERPHNIKGFNESEISKQLEDEEKGLEDIKRADIFKQKEKKKVENDKRSEIQEHRENKMFENTEQSESFKSKKHKEAEHTGISQQKGDKEGANIEQPEIPNMKEKKNTDKVQASGTPKQSNNNKQLHDERVGSIRNPNISKQKSEEGKNEDVRKPEDMERLEDNKTTLYDLQPERKYPEEEPKHPNGVRNSSNEILNEFMIPDEIEKKAISSSMYRHLENTTKQSEDERVRVPDITITIEISDEAEDIKYSIEEKTDNGKVVSVEEHESDEKNMVYSVENPVDDEEDIKYSLEKENTGVHMKYSFEAKNHDRDSKYSVDGKDFPIIRDNAKLEKPDERNEKICHCHVEKLPMITLQKCKPSETKSINCSRIPRRTFKTIPKREMPKELSGNKISHCSNIPTKTERVELPEKAHQWESQTYGTITLHKECGQSIDKTTEMKNNVGINTLIFNKKSDQIKLSKCKAMSCIKRSSSFVSSKNKSDKFDIADGCSENCQRPSTASKIYDRRKQFDSKYTTQYKSSGVEILKNAEKSVVQICQPCSELLSLKSGKMCPRENSSNKYLSKGKVSRCYITENKDTQNSMEKGKGYIKNIPQTKSIRCKQCSQTGGTFEQDIIASYVARCSSNSESPPPEQYVIQTLLYQFAGYELNKDHTSPLRRNSLDRLRSPQIKQPSENAMRSIQVQVGSSYPPKCEAAQTLTTFILTDPRTIHQSESIPTVEGKINYICGPDVPGIRTKVAMNINQIKSVNEDESGISKLECSKDLCESFEQRNSSICPYHEDVSIEAAEKPKPNFKVVKNDKYVFITVTPVQTEPYEPNYYIIVTTPEDDAKTKKESKNNKISESMGKQKVEKYQNLPSSKKYPLDRFKNQIFSIDTLKSNDFLDLFGKKSGVLQKNKTKKTPCDPNNSKCLAALLEKNEVLEADSAIIDQTQKKADHKECSTDTCEYSRGLSNNRNRAGELQMNVENKECGPDTCEYFGGLSKNAIRPKELQIIVEDKEGGPDTCEYLKTSQKNEAINLSFGDEIKETNTVLCGSDNCIHQDEVNKVKSRNVDTFTCPNEPQALKTKEVQCGLDNCSSKKQKYVYNNDKIRISTQTEGFTPKGRSLSKSPRAMVVTVACDVCTSTDSLEINIATPQPEYCDKQVCTNECEKGDVASQVYTGKNDCVPDLCDNFCESIKELNGKGTITEENDSSCSSGTMEEVSSQDEVFVASSWDPNECNSVEALEEKNNAESKDLAECDDKGCPEKTTVSVDKFLHEKLLEETEGPRRIEKCKNSKCFKNIVNTKLDEQDVFALELAMNRFIKVKPDSTTEE